MMPNAMALLSARGRLLILENLAHAQKRGANILAEIIAYGATADAFHITQPIENGEGAARAMQIALKKAGLTPAKLTISMPTAPPRH